MSRNRCVDENSHLQFQLHAEFDDQSDFLLNMPNGNNQSVQQQPTDKSKAAKPFTSTNYLDLARKNRIVTDLDGQINFPKRIFSYASLYSKVQLWVVVEMDRVWVEVEIGWALTFTHTWNRMVSTTCKELQIMQHVQLLARVTLLQWGISLALHMEILLGLQKAYFETLLAQQKNNNMSCHF